MMYNICKDNLCTQTGKNLNFLVKQYGIEDVTALLKMKQVIKKERVHPLQEGEDWKINILNELCLARKGFIELDLGPEEIDIIIDLVATA